MREKNENGQERFFRKFERKNEKNNVNLRMGVDDHHGLVVLLLFDLFDV